MNWSMLNARLKKLDTRIRQLCRQNENCQRILKIPGVGELTATAIVAAVPDPGSFAMAAICRPGWDWFHGNRPAETSKFCWVSVSAVIDIYEHC